MYNDKRLKKVTDKIGIPIDKAIRIIVAEHMINHIIPKKDLATIQVDIDRKTSSKFTKIAKALKVSLDAVFLALLESQLEKELSKKA